VGLCASEHALKKQMTNPSFVYYTVPHVQDGQSYARPENRECCARYDVMMAMKIQVVVFWVVMPCSGGDM
jgi:hypothetical protein